MEIAETVKRVLQEVIVPELGRIKEENHKIVAILELTNKRLDDVNTHLADQSRRIDDLRSELSQRIDDLRSELSQRIEDVSGDLMQQIKEVRAESTQRYDELSKRIYDIHADLINRIDANNERIDRFFLTSVSKERHDRLEKWMGHLQRDVDELKQRLAA
jgi:gas vesicle protein